jgi:hypothetical protein
MTAKSFITQLMAQGRYSFDTEEAARASGSNPVAVRAALRRLREKGDLAVPYKGFYVIVEPEHRVMGCLPASHFIPSLMEHISEGYYAGVLSAAGPFFSIPLFASGEPYPPPPPEFLSSIRVNVHVKTIPMLFLPLATRGRLTFTDDVFLNGRYQTTSCQCKIRSGNEFIKRTVTGSA